MKTPLDRFWREGVRAEMLNRFTRGRTLEKVHTAGGELLFSEMAWGGCAHAGLDGRCHHLDTTRVALTGESVPDSDEQAMTITHGDSKDHRPDWKQAGLELIVAQDGGVPCVSHSWDGKASATPIVQERAEALLTTVQRSSTPRDVVADATLDHEAKAAHLSKRGFMTRLPPTLPQGSQAITQALTWERWHRRDGTTRAHRLA